MRYLWPMVHKYIIKNCCILFISTYARFLYFKIINRFRFKNKIRIRFHMLNFHIKNKPVKCEICGWVSPNRIAFWAHRKKKHVEGFSTRFKCLVCGHGFGDRTKLRVSLTHFFTYLFVFNCGAIGLKRFRFKFVDRLFLLFFSFQEHSYIHSGITDAYKCPYCDKSFRFGSSLSLHKKKCPLKNE